MVSHRVDELSDDSHFLADNVTKRINLRGPLWCMEVPEGPTVAARGVRYMCPDLVN